MRKFWILAAGLLVAAGATAQTRPFADKAQVRFVTAGDLAADGDHAAIVIELAPDTLTYWRNPGEAGVPPSFDWSASQNVAKADLSLPAPTGIKEAGGDVFGYMKRVAYAVRIEPAERSKPVQADLKMDYAACEKICIPMHAEARLELTPTGGPDAKPGVVAEARAALPKPVAAETAVTLAPVAGAAKPTWIVTPKAAGAVDLFAEPPDGYFLETKREPDGSFRLTLAEAPRDAGVPKTPVRFTMPTGAGALEFSLRLDAGRASP